MEKLSEHINSKAIGTSYSDISALNFKSVWSGSSADTFCASLDGALASLKTIEASLNSFKEALDMLDQYKANKERIEELEVLIAGINEYDYNPKTGAYDLYNAEQAKLKTTYQSELTNLKEENRRLKESINSIISSITSVQLESVATASATGSLSNEAIAELARELDVTVDYIMGLNLPEGYTLGGSLLPSGTTPNQYSYVGSHGYPVLASGFPTKAGADGGRQANGRPAMIAGQEFNFRREGCFYEGEFNSLHYTWYSTMTQGVHKNAGQWYICDDGFYRDKDGYIVVAKKGFNNNINDPAQEIVVATPFGLGKVHDACGMDNWVDLYVFDGYPS